MICHFVLIGIYFMESKCLAQCFSLSMVPEPLATASPGHLPEVQIFGVYPTPTESEIGGRT